MCSAGRLQPNGLEAGWWRVSASIGYPFDNDTPVTNATSYSRLTGLGASTVYGVLTSETISLDALTNATVSSEYLDRASRRTTRVTSYPDSSQPAVEIAINGHTVTNIDRAGIVAAYAYDGLGRLTAVTDGRGNTSRTHYNNKGQIDWTEDAASNRTEYAYDQTTGFRSTIIDPLNGSQVALYLPDGQIWGQYGAGTYPVAFKYDYWGRRTWMATFRDDPQMNWNAILYYAIEEYWPADTTQWSYDTPTGLLTCKTYDDGTHVDFAYTADGKLASRTWARGVTTSYDYNDAGDLVSIDYSDSTPDVRFTYDRLGRVLSATNSAAAYFYAYDAFGRLTNEVGPYATLARKYDSLGRSIGYDLLDGNETPEQRVAYQYDSLGRFSGVTWTNRGDSVGCATRYDYEPGSSQIAEWDIWRAGSGVTNRTRRTYDAHRDLLATVSNSVRRPGYGWTLVSAFDYTSDALGRRTARRDGRPGGMTTNCFGYNDRSEVTSALMGTGIYNYDFDPIGNRREASRLEASAAVTNLYAANALNQYTEILASPPSVPSVVNPQYDADGNLTNDGQRVYSWDAENRLVSVIQPGEYCGYMTHAYDHQSRRVKSEWQATWGDWRSRSSEATYDGWNLVCDSQGWYDFPPENWLYTWGLDLSGSLQGAGGIGGLLANAYFSQSSLYFSWAYAFDGNGNVTDLTYHYLTAQNDPYNMTGTSAGHYAYDPFGREIEETGSIAWLNPFRFSTKYRDETGILYYGYRWYDPELGRWLSRDPIGLFRQQSYDDYMMVKNDNINYIDPAGLFIYDERDILWPGGIKVPDCRKCDESQLSFLREDEARARATANNAAIVLEGNLSSHRWISDHFPELWNNFDKTATYGVWLAGYKSAFASIGSAFFQDQHRVKCARYDEKVVDESDPTKASYKLASAYIHGQEITFFPAHFKNDMESRGSTFLHEMSHIYAGTYDTNSRKGPGSQSFLEQPSVSHNFNLLLGLEQSRFEQQIRAWLEGYFR